jgi:hypothetical protein
MVLTIKIGRDEQADLPLIGPPGRIRRNMEVGAGQKTPA